MVALPGSPAICAGLASNITAGVTTDQRGYPNTNTAYAGYSPDPVCIFRSGADRLLAQFHGRTIADFASHFDSGEHSLPGSGDAGGEWPSVQRRPVSVGLTLDGSGASNADATTSSGVASYSTLRVSAVGTGTMPSGEPHADRLGRGKRGDDLGQQQPVQ